MGRLVAVVGPSGAGKDTVMEAYLARYPKTVLARRVITRPSAAGGEDFEGVSEEEFAKRKAAGVFLADWQAHGLSYGLPLSIRDELAAGKTVIFNGSRAALPEIHARYPTLVTLVITAPDAVLAKRLAARGRESEADIRARLTRITDALPVALQAFEISNNGTVEQAVAAMADVLQPESV